MTGGVGVVDSINSHCLMFCHSYKSSKAVQSRRQSRMDAKHLMLRKLRRLDVSRKWCFCNTKHHLSPEPRLAIDNQEFIDNTWPFQALILDNQKVSGTIF
jgi:hypothetical protein